MILAVQPSSDVTTTLSSLPDWITSPNKDQIAAAAFSSGAALSLFDIVVRNVTGSLPAALWRDRLAMDVAIACLRLHRRNENQTDIRDAICLTRAGEAFGPAGEMFDGWRRIARVRVGTPGWVDRTVQILPPSVADTCPVRSMMLSTDGTPADRAARMLADVLMHCPREEVAALMLADAVLARALRWSFPVPLLAAHLTRRDLSSIARKHLDPGPAVHAAITMACDSGLRLAAVLTRRAAKLHSVSPRLRTKGADAALQVFLSHDAVSPSSMLSPQIVGTTKKMTDRAARRFCDRLVTLGVAKELTGRASFRLYGL